MARGDRYSNRQIAQYHSLLEIVGEYGPYDQSPNNDGAHYFDAADNPFIEEGMSCGNCVFFAEPRGCMIVEGRIDEDGLCKLWIIPDNRLSGWMEV